MRLPPPTLARSAESLGVTAPPPRARAARDALRSRWGGVGSRLCSVRATSFPWRKFALRLAGQLGVGLRFGAAAGGAGGGKGAGV